MLRDPAFGYREPLGSLVNHAQATSVDLALAQRDLPFVPLRGGPFGQQCGEADDFIATSRSEDVVVLLPGAGLRLGLNWLAMVGGLTEPRFFSRSIGLLVRLVGRAVYAHAPMFVLRGPLAAASVGRAGAAPSSPGGWLSQHRADHRAT